MCRIPPSPISVSIIFIWLRIHQLLRWATDSNLHLGKTNKGPKEVSMFRFWKSVLCLFSSFCLFSSAHAEDLDPLSSAYLSDKEYAKNIEVQAYLVTRDQVVKLFSEENGKVIQKTNKELYRKEIYLLVRCKNFGDYRAFGTLNCRILNEGDPISIEIMMMPGYMKSYYDTVIPLYSGSIPNNEKTPFVSSKWKDLYTI
jgi:hypothetical protein